MDPHAESAIYSRIRRLGKAGRVICTFSLVFSVLGFAVATYGILSGQADVKTTIGPVTIDRAKPSGSEDPSNKNLAPKAVRQPIPSDGLATKAGLVAITALGMAFWMTGLWLMRCLFVQFIQGEIFTAGTARLMKWLGVWSLIQVISFNLNFLLIGLFLLALGWGMNLAASLKHEHELTV